MSNSANGISNGISNGGEKFYESSVKFCNCAGCGVRLLGASTPSGVRDELVDKGYLLVRGRIKGRPYCCGCLETVKIKTLCQENGLTPRQAAVLYKTSG